MSPINWHLIPSPHHPGPRGLSRFAWHFQPHSKSGLVQKTRFSKSTCLFHKCQLCIGLFAVIKKGQAARSPGGSSSHHPVPRLETSGLCNGIWVICWHNHTQVSVSLHVLSPVSTGSNQPVQETPKQHFVSSHTCPLTASGALECAEVLLQNIWASSCMYVRQHRNVFWCSQFTTVVTCQGTLWHQIISAPHCTRMCTHCVGITVKSFVNCSWCMSIWTTFQAVRGKRYENPFMIQGTLYLWWISTIKSDQGDGWMKTDVRVHKCSRLQLPNITRINPFNSKSRANSFGHLPYLPVYKSHQDAPNPNFCLDYLIRGHIKPMCKTGPYFWCSILGQKHASCTRTWVDTVSIMRIGNRIHVQEVLLWVVGLVWKCVCVCLSACSSTSELWSSPQKFIPLQLTTVTAWRNNSKSKRFKFGQTWAHFTLKTKKQKPSNITPPVVTKCFRREALS